MGNTPCAIDGKNCESRNVLSVVELRRCRDGEFVRAAGCVIARQRPGTAKGFIFLSMDDETGIANVIVTPDLYERDRLTSCVANFYWWRITESGWGNSCQATRLTALVDGAI